MGGACILRESWETCNLGSVFDSGGRSKFMVVVLKGVRSMLTRKCLQARINELFIMTPNIIEAYFGKLTVSA